VLCYADGHAFVGLDVATGNPRWRFEVGELGRYTSLDRMREGAPAAHPILSGGYMFGCFKGHHLVALRLRDGAQQWLRRVDEPFPTNFAYDPRGRLAFLTPEALAELDPSTGAVLAEHALRPQPGEPIRGSLSPMDVTDDHILTVDEGGTLCAISRTTGTVDFSAPLSGRVVEPPVATSGHVFVADLDGQLYAFGAR
jgi:outer membrane protein assembly factor BamB